MTRMRRSLLLLLLLGWLIPIGVGVYARFSYTPKDNADFSIFGHMLVEVLACMCAVGWLALAIIGALCCLFKAKEKPKPLDYCTNCGYSLRGLPEPRCRESGVEFDPTDMARCRHTTTRWPNSQRFDAAPANTFCAMPIAWEPSRITRNAGEPIGPARRQQARPIAPIDGPTDS